MGLLRWWFVYIPIVILMAGLFYMPRHPEFNGVQFCADIIALSLLAGFLALVNDHIEQKKRGLKEKKELDTMINTLLRH